MNKIALLDKPVSSLIRIHGNDMLKDAVALATQLLTPYKNVIRRDEQKFSSALFTVLAMKLAISSSDALLQDIFELLFSAPGGDGIDKIMWKNAMTLSNHTKDPSVIHYVSILVRQITDISFNENYRMAGASIFHWRKAFGLEPLKRDEILFYTREKRPAPNLSKLDIKDIRMGTRYDLDDATAIARKMLAPVQGNTDAQTYVFAGNLLVMTMFGVRCDKGEHSFEKVIEFLEDKNWDNERQITLHLMQIITYSEHEYFIQFQKEWGEKVTRMPALKSLLKRSIELYRQAFKLKGVSASPETIKATTVPANSVRIFDPEAIGRAQTLMADCKEDRKSGGERILESASANGGYRTIPDMKKAVAVLESYKSRFENLIEPIERLQLNLTLAGAMKPEKFRVTPILLLGDPGIGKTYLAMMLADSLGGRMEKMSAGGGGVSFDFTGSHSSWTGARCGRVFQSLAEGNTANPVFVIDEVDKMPPFTQYPLLPMLLDLLEPGTAKSFKDEFFNIDFDASRIIFILTANDLKLVPEPLQSRVNVFTVPRPDTAQRMRIILAEALQLREETGTKIILDKSDVRELARREDLDLRITVRIVRDAFTKALMNGKTIASMEILEGGCKGENSYGKHGIGFCSNVSGKHLVDRDRSRNC